MVATTIQEASHSTTRWSPWDGASRKANLTQLFATPGATGASKATQESGSCNRAVESATTSTLAGTFKCLNERVGFGQLLKSLHFLTKSLLSSIKYIAIKYRSQEVSFKFTNSKLL